MKDWDDIRVFLALAREGSVSAAAEALGVNHSTVSRRIAALEEKLESRLFDRLKSGYALTAAGEEIRAYAEDMEQAAFALDREIAGRDTRASGPVRVTVSESILLSFLMDDLARFQIENPEIELRLLASDRVHSLSEREADIAIRVTGGPEETLVGRKFATFAYAVYGRKNVEPTGWIGWTYEEETPLWVKRHFPDLPLAFRVNSTLAKYHAVSKGYGISQLPCSYGDLQPHLERLTDAELYPGWDIWVLTHGDIRKTARVRKVLDFLSETLSTRRDLIEGRAVGG
ncbi:MAG: LysR family transcriptional regulator [Alphaproteobacteria bacterium]